MTDENGEPASLDHTSHDPIEQIREERVERWIFIREVVIVLIAAAILAARLVFGG